MLLQIKMPNYQGLLDLLDAKHETWHDQTSFSDMKFSFSLFAIEKLTKMLMSQKKFLLSLIFNKIFLLFLSWFEKLFLLRECQLIN